MLRELFGVEKVADWPGIDLPRLMGTLVEAARGVESKPADPEMLFTRLSDAFRAMDFDPPEEERWTEAWYGKSKVEPPSPEVAAKMKRVLGDEDWKRIHLLVETLQDKTIWELIRQRCLAWGSERVAVGIFVAFAAWADLLTVPLLLKSTFRIEEFARKWIDAIGGTVAGEKEKESEKRVRNLDYGKVLDNLEKAQKAREEHRKRLEEIEAKRRQEEYERTQRE